RTVQFPELRAQLVNEAWNGEAHLDYKSSDLTQIQRWLARQGLDSSFVLPAAFREMHLHGCQVLKAENCRVPMLCLADGVKHLHVFVVSGDQIAGLPPQGVPDFQKCGAWKTAAWREGRTTYILSGLKTQAFVSKFRRSGRWTFSG